MAGITDDYDEIFRLEFQAGRFFTPFESSTAANRAIIGSVLAEKLFGKRHYLWSFDFIIGLGN